ncbi:hypothetical protein [Agromyces sp. SYSU T0242]|uniref:hypothetical protein n=1 Tax=Agromyces litoreus TaxID=3158561 RepID=UPI00339B928C
MIRLPYEPSPWDAAQDARARAADRRREQAARWNPAPPARPEPPAPNPRPKLNLKPKPEPAPPPALTIPEGSVVLSREEYQAVKALMRAVPDLDTATRARRHRGGTQRF